MTTRTRSWSGSTCGIDVEAPAVSRPRWSTCGYESFLEWRFGDHAAVARVEERHDSGQRAFAHVSSDGCLVWAGEASSVGDAMRACESAIVAAAMRRGWL